MSVYGSGDADAKFPDLQQYRDKLSYLPWPCTLKDGTKAEIDLMRKDEVDQGLMMFNEMLKGGVSWPYIEDKFNKSRYLGYYCAEAVFVVRTVESKDDSCVLGTFYIKPNYPGRCSEICNSGFITNCKFRRKGVATICGRAYLRMAKDLGYRASVFNLVFDINKPSIRIWQRLGFIRIGTVPKCAQLKNIVGYVDAHIYYYDLTQYDHRAWPMDKVFLQDDNAKNTTGSSSMFFVWAVLIAFVGYFVSSLDRHESVNDIYSHIVHAIRIFFFA